MPTLFGEALRRRAGGADRDPALVLRNGELLGRGLEARVHACAAALRADGLARGETVGVTVGDEADHVVVALALLVLGVAQVALPTFDPPAVRRRLAERLRVSRVVASSPGHALDGYAFTRIASAAEATGDATVTEPLDADPDAIALLCPSSGTTGEPKVVALSQRQLAGRHARRNFAPGERLLVPASVEHVRWKLARLAVLWRGGTNVLADDPAPTTAQIARACTRHAVTRIDVGAMHLANFVQGDAEALPASLKVFVSGSRVPMRMRERFAARTRAALYVEYGARETGAMTGTYPHDPEPERETVGLPLPFAVVEVVDADGAPVANGEVGEIRMRHDDMLDGYFGDPAATARHFRDGCFYPGDLGSFTAAGSLCLAGRTDDVMNLNGIKIYPSEIERVLEDEPGVRAAAAFAVDSAVHGQIPVVAVVWSGQGAADPSRLQARARARLGVRAPRRVVLVDELPRTSAGKVATTELRRLVEGAPKERP